LKVLPGIGTLWTWSGSVCTFLFTGCKALEAQKRHREVPFCLLES